MPETMFEKIFFLLSLGLGGACGLYAAQKVFKIVLSKKWKEQRGIRKISGESVGSFSTILVRSGLAFGGLFALLLGIIMSLSFLVFLINGFPEQ